LDQLSQLPEGISVWERALCIARRTSCWGWLPWGIVCAPHRCYFPCPVAQLLPTYPLPLLLNLQSCTAARLWLLLPVRPGFLKLLGVGGLLSLHELCGFCDLWYSWEIGRPILSSAHVELTGSGQQCRWTSVQCCGTHRNQGSLHTASSSQVFHSTFCSSVDTVSSVMNRFLPGCCLPALVWKSGWPREFGTVIFSSQHKALQELPAQWGASCKPLWSC
jgi:hypothetical protein